MQLKTGFKIGFARIPRDTNLILDRSLCSSGPDFSAFSNNYEPLARLENWFSDGFDSLRESWQGKINPPSEVLDKTRFWELDASRGLAICMMITMHLAEGWGKVVSKPLANAFLRYAWSPVKDLAITGIATALLGTALTRSDHFSRWVERFTPISQPLTKTILAYLCAGWFAYQMATGGSGASAFLFITGISMAIKQGRSMDADFLHQDLVRRGVGIFALGLVITALSWLIIPKKIVFFGVLHLIGAATLLSIPFLSLPPALTAMAGLSIWGSGKYLLPLFFKNGFPLFLSGLFPMVVSSFDYTPLFPWMGFILVGIAVGKKLYPEGTRRSFSLPDLSPSPVLRFLEDAGQKSLKLYMAQAPLSFAGIALAGE
ncbi:MAG: heparan-alpha-glucosaminide N-acetyltransferase [Chloroflexi bacterium]|nr:heparan-alpha-glucosaminide N-acetyltransferase [Chloroflexota bacterium]